MDILGEAAENGVTAKSTGDVPSVEAIAYTDGRLFIGGQFRNAGSLDVNGIAFWDGNKWNSLGPDSTNGVRRKIVVENDTIITSGFVYALYVHNQKLYVGGHFNLAGNQDANGVAVWDINSGTWDTMQGGSRGITKWIRFMHTLLLPGAIPFL